MNREWSQLNKTMQTQLGKRDTYTEGIGTLFTLRENIIRVLTELTDNLTKEQLCAMPYPDAEGYHSKTIAYSLWHIFRIEDIVAHTLINADEQVFFSGGYKERTGSPIITTGNELAGQQIAEFSAALDIGALREYITEVKKSTEDIISSLSYDDMKRKIPPERKEELVSLGVVSEDESASWLIDYWCGKDIRGLIKMPFSRHWIMHTEASLRIRDRLMR